jgi:ribosome-binding protein aMBF1 (putative translation factor)
MARKMEKILRITLVEISQEEGVVKQEKEEKTEGLTIGDILKLNR